MNLKHTTGVQACNTVHKCFKGLLFHNVFTSFINSVLIGAVIPKR